MVEEIWKDILEIKGLEGFEGLYQVSNLGRVKNRKDKILKPDTDRYGYKIITLCKNGKHKKVKLHRLVLKVFNQIEDDINYQVNHIDGDKTNNKLENLEWCTGFQNQTHRRFELENDSITIKQYDKDKNLIAEYKTATEASKVTGISLSYIYDVLKGKYKKARGFVFTRECI